MRTMLMMKRCLQKMQNCSRVQVSGLLLSRLDLIKRDRMEDLFAAQLTDGLTINQKDKTRWTRPLQQRQHQSKLSALPEKYIGDPHKVHL